MKRTRRGANFLPRRRFAKEEQPRVAVLGGGVAGMTVAHELGERDFKVDVYEATPHTFGGKAASQTLAGTGKEGRRDLPGEHGFRFFPSFYRHVIDTMDRIPVDNGRQAVSNSLKESEMMAMAEGQGKLFVFEREVADTPQELRYLIDTIERFFARTGTPVVDMVRFAKQMWRFMTSCDQRRLAEFESMSFWDFVQGDSYSPHFQKYIETPRFMVAMDPRKGSARTIGTKAIQILLDFMRNGTRTDAVLDGPTTERWLIPWFDYLTKSLGVAYHFNKAVTELDIGSDRKIKGVKLSDGSTVTADYYVLCVPLDKVGALLSDRIVEAEPFLKRVRQLSVEATSWMVGFQFYLNKKTPICNGHVAYPISDWSLSSVSQGQFWSEDVQQTYGDGNVVDILSVDVSAWDEISPRNNKCAQDCTKEELIEEVICQLEEGLADQFDRKSIVRVHVDSNIEFPEGGGRVINRTPLLVHPPGSWFKRPSAELSGIENLFLASDYVKTNTDLASMEGANEAARRAVNGILRKEGYAENRDCLIFSMEEESGAAVDALKRIDRVAFLGQKAHALGMVDRALNVMGSVSSFTTQTQSRDVPRSIQAMRDLEESGRRMVRIGGK
jgi:15-cis-phytoene desaturase